MSNKSGVATQVISLPSGGGALQGIGETFAPDLFTGTGNLSVPITVPSGRNGFQPNLTLSYSTGNGNGPFGLGWALSTPEITRKTSRGVPRYLDDAADPEDHDTFLLSGAEDLVPVAQPSPGVTRFRPRTEGLFARIEHIRDGADLWRVQGRDGLISRFGGTGSPEAVIADPRNPSKIFSWKLTETTDPFGNRICYDYRRDRAEDGLRAWDQVYLETIRYVDYGDNAFLVSITFLYEDQPDPVSHFSNHRAGFEVRTRLRCKRIEIRTHPADENHLARSIDLTYLDDRVRIGELDAGLLPRNGVSLLSQVRVTGHDGTDTQELPPLEFGYSTFDPEGRRAQPVEGTGGTMTRRSLADEDLELVSLFGNGLPDIIEMNGGTRFWRNLGNGMYDEPRTMPEVPVGVRLGDPGTQFGDLNGDGRADLLALDRGGYFPLSFTGRWSPRGFVRYATPPSVPFGDGNLRLVDLDGDGVVDALRTGSNFQLFFNDPVHGWGAVATRPRGPLEEFPDVSFDNPRVKLADLSGDGLQDIVLIGQRRVDYWPSFGHGRWGARVTMAKSPFFDDGVLPVAQFDPRRVLLGDMDGDGLDDVIYVEPGRVTIWINQSGNSWSDPIRIQNTPSFPDIDAVRLVDLLGTGTAGILWTSNSPGATLALHRFLDLTAAVKPYLLEMMTNNIGAVTQIRYASSTKFYLSDQQSSSPWQTPLPFPVQVVARTTVLDEISRSKLTTSYRYHHGYWDGVEREFRGFGRVDQIDTEQHVDDFNNPDLPAEDSKVDPVQQSQFAPPLLTKTWFHLGPIGDEFADRFEADFTGEYWSGDPQFLPRPTATQQILGVLTAVQRADALRTLRGQSMRTEIYALDGSEGQLQPFTVTESQYGIREESPPPDRDSDRQRVFFSHVDGQRTTQWERGTDPMTQFTFSEDYDIFGLARRQIIVGVPRGRDFRVTSGDGNPYLGTTTTSTFAQRDDQLYIVDRAARVTVHEIVNNGSPTLLELRRAIGDGTIELPVVGETRTYYDGQPFTGLELGRLGKFGASVRTENLVLTEKILNDAYRLDSGGSAIPPYLNPGEAPGWTEEYPQEFRDHTAPHAGYTVAPVDSVDSVGTMGFYVSQHRRQYDFHAEPGTGHGLLTGFQNQIGGEAQVEYDDVRLLPVRVTDPAGMVTEVVHNYRVLQPERVTDENGNRTAYSYTPLGLPGSTSIMGKEEEVVGDTVETPSTKFVYDFSQQPVAVRTIRRAAHLSDSTSHEEQRAASIESVQYSDGFGRLVQTRAQADDVRWGDPLFGSDLLAEAQGDLTPQQEFAGVVRGAEPNVVVSGWQVYDNKGRVVEKYEPFFASGWKYEQPIGAQRGRCVSMLYDARGRLTSTRHPDGAEELVVYGVPADMSAPNRFAPTPWEVYTYDANDNAGRTSAAEASGYQDHWNTPMSCIVDALGRVVNRTERRREPGSDSPVSDIKTEFSYDVLGNMVSVTDASGRSAMRNVYDFMGRSLRVVQLDEGVRRIVLDAAGNVVEIRDDKDALHLQAYDVLLRPIRRWARDEKNEPVSLRERLEYGDGGDAQQLAQERAENKAMNRLGKVHRHFDESGLLVFARYDFKQNVVDRVRQVISDEVLLGVFPDPVQPQPDWTVKPFRVNWHSLTGINRLAETVLDSTIYETSATFDALNRVSTIRLPTDVTGHRSELRPIYSRAGGLERVELDGQILVAHIVYNAAGQRTLVASGNGVLTRYAFDPRSRRLLRLRSERYAQPDPLHYQPRGDALQDLAYTYDLAGNVLELIDRARGSGVRGNPEAGLVDDPRLRALVVDGNALVRRFKYDALYRLISATGRECSRLPSPQPWRDDPRCGSAGGIASPANAAEVTIGYAETYRYDAVGNLVRLRHTNRGTAWARQFALFPGTNRLRTMGSGADSFTYTFDQCGNMTDESTSRHFDWDYGNRMKAYRTQVGNEEPSVYVQYLYDPSGERVKKLTRRQGGIVESAMYIDGVFEHHRWNSSGASGANNYLHVMDGDQRVALLRRGPAHPDDFGPPMQYHLGDHLGSSTLVLDANSGFVNREEYTPYGETSFGSFGRKRYRFTSRERDEESGLYYHGARYYSPGVGRWTSCDPQPLADGTNPYRYVRNDPLAYRDPHGMEAEARTQRHTGSRTQSGSDAAADGSPGPIRRATEWLTSLDVALRDAYKALNVSRAAAAHADVRALNGLQPGEAARIAKQTSTLRNVLRAETQDKLTPGGRLLSKLLDKEQNWTKITRRYGDPFNESLPASERVAIANKIIEKSQSTSKWMNRFQWVGKGVVALGVAASSLQILHGVEKIYSGRGVEGTIDVAEGATNGGLAVGVYGGVRSGAIAVEAGLGASALTVGATGLASGSVTFAFTEIRRSASGERTAAAEASDYWADLYVSGDRQGGAAGFGKKIAGGVLGSFSALISFGQGDLDWSF